MNAPKIICHNHMQPHACAGCHPKALLKFSTFDSDPDRTPQILAAAMGPMGLRHVWPFVLAPSGRSWQTHAWGCCQHVWALCHALGCTLRACFGVPTLFGRHLGIPLSQLGFWQFFAVFGQPACQFSCSVAPKGGWPLKLGAFAMPPPKMGTQSPTGKGVAWVPKHHFPLKRVWRFLTETIY